MGNDDNSSGEVDIDGVDYDSNYDEDDGPGWNAEDSEESSGPTLGLDSATHGSEAPTKITELKTTTPSTERHVEMLAFLHKVQAKRSEELDKAVRETHANFARDRLLEGTRETSRDHDKKRQEIMEQVQEISKENRSKSRRSINEDTPKMTADPKVPVFTAANHHFHDEGINVTRHRQLQKKEKTRRITTYVYS